MIHLEMIEDMLALQQRLNDDTNGKGWEEGTASNGKLISWKRCIYMECAELMDSFSWKHRKSVNAKTDKVNAQVEIADIWHFMLSLVLERAYPNSSIKEVAKDITSISGFNDFCLDAYDMSEYNIYEIMNDIEIIIHDTSGFGFQIHDLLTNYFRLSLKCGINLYTLYKIYIGKNVLNKFRQDNGYQDGSYLKNWNGREDNTILNEILDSGVLKEDEIYKELTKNYAKVK
ncbi:MAG: dUTPase [Campylobacter sp.]|nr:dUTPase [Campylobacter sp.]